MKVGDTYKVSTRHRFEGKFVETIKDKETDEPILHVFDCGIHGKGGKSTLRRVPASTFIGATKVK